MGLRLMFNFGDFLVTRIVDFTWFQSAETDLIRRHGLLQETEAEGTNRKRDFSPRVQRVY